MNAPIHVSDIMSFFVTSTRDKNDEMNKCREKVLRFLHTPPQEFLEHPEYGEKWRSVSQEWKTVVHKVTVDTGVPEHTSTQLEARGGRGCHYDYTLNYYKDTLVASRKLEFKKGGSTLCKQPQFLSLQVKFGLFPVTYDLFYYDYYLVKYLACDTEITEKIPTREEYLEKVTSTTSKLPFFVQLKEREFYARKEKKAVVQESIREYLKQYGKDLDLQSFAEKVKETQTDKHYLLWNKGKFCYDRLLEHEMSNMTYHSIKNGNTIQIQSGSTLQIQSGSTLQIQSGSNLQIQSGSTMYSLLLRWRNHQGILNPAWQISLKRISI